MLVTSHCKSKWVSLPINTIFLRLLLSSILFACVARPTITRQSAFWRNGRFSLSQGNRVLHFCVSRTCCMNKALGLGPEKLTMWLECVDGQMLALMSTAKPGFLEIDNDKFKTIMKISNEEGIEQRKDRSGKDEDASKTLQLLRIKGFPRLLPEGIQALVNYCRYLRELCLSYSLLSDELLLALSSEKHMQLETLRLEVHQEIKPLPRVSDTAWCTFSSRLPNINLVLSSYMTNEDDQSLLLAPYVPITHLYFGEAPSEATLLRIGCVCPRLVELVIAAYGPDKLDRALVSVAEGCACLSAVGLGDCEITCSGLLEFVTLCAKRLRILYVWETSLIEDFELDVTELSKKISQLLGRTWVPEYIPC